MSVRFIHAADIHLERPFQGLSGCPEAILTRVRQSTFSALANLVEAAIDRKVDFVIMAGDVFDQSSRGLRAETRLREYMKKLALHGIEVFMTHGNHDPLDGFWSGLTYGENVHVFESRPQVRKFVKPNQPSVHLYGFSYATQHVTESMIDHYEKQPGGDYHIGILHGSVRGNTEHDVYAPFQLSDLIKTEMDYWALGHIHKNEILNQDPPIIYPGSLQGLSVKETGAKGCYLVTMDKHSAHTEFIKTSDIVWESPVLDISGIETLESLIQATEEIKEKMRQSSCGVLMRIKLVGESTLFHKTNQSILSDLIEVLRTGEDERQEFVWVTDIIESTTPVFDRDKLRKGKHFIGDLVRLIDQKETVTEDIEPLYFHNQAKRFLSPPSKVGEMEMMRAAEKLLLTGLHKAGKRL